MVFHPLHLFAGAEVERLVEVDVCDGFVSNLAEWLNQVADAHVLPGLSLDISAVHLVRAAARCWHARLR